MRANGLSRQILLSMTALVAGITTIVLVSLYAFYALLFLIDPPLAPCTADSYLPTWPEWIFMGILILASLATAIIAAKKLSARLLTPLNSVAESVRRVAHGDLNARAVAGDRSLGETATLVDDFNSMAERLQRTAHELTTWNAAIAHELRTPVTILRGRLQGLAEGVFVPDPTQFRSLLRQVEDLSRLIEDLRVLSLADGGQLNLWLTLVPLAEEIQELSELMTPSLLKAGMELKLDLEEMNVICDAARIRQILIALLDNVCRYANPGVVVIESRTYNNWVHISVRDSGPGLKDEFELHAFEAFQRGHDSRSRKSGGSGLGLAVVRAIAESHRGRARYSRSDDGGSNFEISFPITHDSSI